MACLLHGDMPGLCWLPAAHDWTLCSCPAPPAAPADSPASCHCSLQRPCTCAPSSACTNLSPDRWKGSEQIRDGQKLCRHDSRASATSSS